MRFLPVVCPSAARLRQAGFLLYVVAIGMEVQVKGADGLLRSLDKLPQQARDAAGRGVFRATTRVFGDAIKNAPRSPTMAQAARATRKTRADTGKRKKATAFTRAKPGGLERSISMQVDKTKIEGSVFVALNSDGGKYAKRIHDEKGKTWRKRGPGTIAKGPRADHKFIKRALDDNENNIGAIMADEMRRVNL